MSALFNNCIKLYAANQTLYYKQQDAIEKKAFYTAWLQLEKEALANHELNKGN